jgi:hypothetical protein
MSNCKAGLLFCKAGLRAIIDEKAVRPTEPIPSKARNDPEYL